MSQDLRLTPSRLAYRSSSDAEKIRDILTREKICTISYLEGGQVYALPTAFVLFNDRIVIHGSVKSRFLDSMKGQQVCITVFGINGLVLAASAFHHSMNYESVVVFAEPEEITDTREKAACLEAFTEKITPGRWKHLREVSKGELAATRVMSFPLDNVSCKIRTGGPNEDKADENFPVWTGVIPLKQQLGTPEPVPSKTELDLPEHITNLY